jgi:hypothetical protein
LASTKTNKNNVMKISVLAFVALFGFAFTACKKDYTCKCQRVYTNNDGETTTENDQTYTFKDSEARAATRCNDQEGTGSTITGDYTRECELD